MQMQQALDVKEPSHGKIGMVDALHAKIHSLFHIFHSPDLEQHLQMTDNGMSASFHKQTANVDR